MANQIFMRVNEVADAYAGIANPFSNDAIRVTLSTVLTALLNFILTSPCIIY